MSENVYRDVARKDKTAKLVDRLLHAFLRISGKEPHLFMDGGMTDAAMLMAGIEELLIRRDVAEACDGNLVLMPLAEAFANAIQPSKADVATALVKTAELFQKQKSLGSSAPQVNQPS